MRRLGDLLKTLKKTSKYTFTAYTLVRLGKHKRKSSMNDRSESSRSSRFMILDNDKYSLFFSFSFFFLQTNPKEREASGLEGSCSQL